MIEQERKQFYEMLAECMAQYAQKLPEVGLLAAWWKSLSPFPLRTVAAGFASYVHENDTFPPVPAGIVKRCKLLDGRPEAEEAWAMSLLSKDEAETVVWTQEMAEAFAIARPVLDSSGAISARKTFIEAYQRLIDVARYQLKAPVWIVSEGYDKGRKKLAVDDAVRKGMLPAPQAVALLAAPIPVKDGQIGFPEQDVAPDDKARAQLSGIKAMLAQMAAEKQAKIDATPTDAQLEDQRKAEIAEQVRQYASQRHDVGLAAPMVQKPPRFEHD